MKRNGSNFVRKVYNGFPFFVNFADSIMELINSHYMKEGMKMKFAGDIKLLILIGAGAIVSYSLFGPTGVVGFGVLCCLAKK